jgi:hypothetical protein
MIREQRQAGLDRAVAGDLLEVDRHEEGGGAEAAVDA